MDFNLSALIIIRKHAPNWKESIIHLVRKFIFHHILTEINKGESNGSKRGLLTIDVIQFIGERNFSAPVEGKINTYFVYATICYIEVKIVLQNLYVSLR